MFLFWNPKVGIIGISGHCSIGNPLKLINGLSWYYNTKQNLYKSSTKYYFMCLSQKNDWFKWVNLLMCTNMLSNSRGIMFASIDIIDACLSYVIKNKITNWSVINTPLTWSTKHRSACVLIDKLFVTLSTLIRLSWHGGSVAGLVSCSLHCGHHW